MDPIFLTKSGATKSEGKTGAILIIGLTVTLFEWGLGIISLTLG